jgi:hypothetical protein
LSQANGSGKSRTIFIIRLLIYALAGPLFVALPHHTAAILIAVLMVSTLLLDFATRKTLWLRLHILPLGLFGAYFMYAALRLYMDVAEPLTDISILVGTAFIWMGLSSDAIFNRQNAAWLLAAWLIATALTVAVHGYPQIARVYIPFSLIAATSGLFLPPAEHLVHTSLDYWFGRIEIISYGMKKPLAVGVRRC